VGLWLSVFIPVDIDKRKCEHIDNPLGHVKSRPARNIRRVLKNYHVVSFGLNGAWQLEKTRKQFRAVNNLVYKNAVAYKQGVDHRAGRNLVCLKEVLVDEQHHTGGPNKSFNRIQDKALLPLFFFY